MLDTTQDYQLPIGSESDIKAVENMLSWTLVNLHNEEMMHHLFPNQPTLLGKLKQEGFPPVRIHEMCLKDDSVPKKLIKYGLKFTSLKEAGVTPSSVLGIKYLAKHNGYFYSSEWESEITIYDLIEDLGFNVKELLEDGFKEKNIPPEYLVNADYSLEQLKKMGVGFNTNKKLFPLEEIINSYDLKKLYYGGVSATNLTNRYSCSELYAAGYSPKALQNAGFDAQFS